MTCAHFTQPGDKCCAAGIDLQKLAGGGVFYQVLRLPCIPITNRRGEVASKCELFKEGAPA